MDENLTLRESERTLNKLHLLSTFFEDEIVYKIYLRTQVIHKMYATNPELDINKLDLFHTQFTLPAIDLLRRIKKINESKVGLLFTEISLNEDLIKSIRDSDFNEADFNNDKQRQATRINNSLRRLYQTLSDGVDEYPLVRSINAFSARYADDFFYTIDASLLAELTDYEQKDVYTSAHVVIHKKLMGRLCKYDFRTAFYCGLKTGDLLLEVYRFLDDDDHFVFYPSRNLFLLMDLEKIKDINLTTDVTRNRRIIQELEDKNDQLKSRAHLTRINIPAEVKELLAENYKKISDINFLQNIASFDAQANILKTMLNTDII